MRQTGGEHVDTYSVGTAAQGAAQDRLPHEAFHPSTPLLTVNAPSSYTLNP